MQGFIAKKFAPGISFPALTYCIYTPYMSIPHIRNPSANGTRVQWWEGECVNRYTRIIFTTRKILPAVHKNLLASLQQSMIVYQCVCRCDCRYVDRTSQRLQDRINQPIPRCIRSDKRPTKNLPNRECKTITTPCVYCDSAIGQHLLENEECAKHFNDVQFSILATARSWFHLSVLEATYTNSLQPILCRQKEFVYSLQISH